MAKKGIVPATAFKKGQSGNPNGRPVSLAKRIPYMIINDPSMPEPYKPKDISDALLTISTMKEDDLYALSQNQEATALERTLANAMLGGLRSGDYKTIAFILERTISKPKEIIELDATIAAVVQKITLPDGSIITL